MLSGTRNKLQKFNSNKAWNGVQLRTMTSIDGMFSVVSLRLGGQDSIMKAKQDLTKVALTLDPEWKIEENEIALV